MLATDLIAAVGIQPAVSVVTVTATLRMLITAPRHKPRSARPAADTVTRPTTVSGVTLWPDSGRIGGGPDAAGKPGEAATGRNSEL